MIFFNRTGSKIVLPIFLLIFMVCAVQAQTFNGAGFTIVDGGGRVAASCSTVAVSGITANTTVNSISLNSFNHTWLGDLEVRVYLPGAAPPPSLTNSVVITSPPDGRSCNFAGTYRFVDTAAQSIDAATTGCSTTTNLAPGNYRTSTYGGGTANGPVTSLTTSFGTLTPAQANGNWLICVFDFVSTDGGTVGSTSIEFPITTAAGATLGGRVMSASGNGIAKTQVTIINQSGISQTVLTNSFGYYNFEEIETGETYTITVADKRFTFQNPSVVVNVSENIDNLNFTANE